MMTLAFMILGFFFAGIVSYGILECFIIWLGFVAVGMILDGIFELIKRGVRRRLKRYKKVVDKRR